MDYQIKTTYCREDIEGFYNAFLSRKKLYRMTKKSNQFIMTTLAYIFWGMAALYVVALLLTGRFSFILDILPGIIILVAIGYIFFWTGSRGLRSKATWKSYPYKGEELTFIFMSDGFIQTQRNLETKTAYAGIVRLYEDNIGFYLFVTPKNAYILPKRSYASPADVDSFRGYIANATGLTIEHS